MYLKQLLAEDIQMNIVYTYYMHVLNINVQTFQFSMTTRTLLLAKG